ncbi:MAG: MFS transporter, partial [Acidobacteriota bacterium]|nr:MFS transporter [Acidobacteriota bacterium]
MEQSAGTTLQARGYKTIVFVICIVAALGGLLFGLDQGFINNALSVLTEHYGLDVPSQESYSAILAMGGILGALLSGFFARFLGRKRSFVLAGFI